MAQDLNKDLNKDSFWDGSNNKLSETQLDPSKYHDVAAEVMPLSGRSVASLLPAGAGGMRGTIIRSAGEQGAPLGHDPDAVATRINVDPDIPGQSFVYDPTQITQEALANAMAEGNTATSVEERRFKAANVLKQFAVRDHNGQTKQAEISPVMREAPVNLPGTYVVPASTDGGGQVPMQDSKQEAPALIGVELGRPATPVQRGGLAPQQPPTEAPAPPSVAPVAASPVKAASFGTAPAATTIQQPATIPAVPVSLFQPHLNTPEATTAPLTENNGAQAPTVKISFEVRGMPFKQDAFFHQVVREGHALILVFDTRAVGYPMTFPQMPEDVSNAPDIAVYLEGSNSIYVTAMTGIQFPLDQYEICVLLIKDEQPLPQ
jgi:hypothetical protein